MNNEQIDIDRIQVRATQKIACHMKKEILNLKDQVKILEECYEMEMMTTDALTNSLISDTTKQIELKKQMIILTNECYRANEKAMVAQNQVKCKSQQISRLQEELSNTETEMRNKLEI